MFAYKTLDSGNIQHYEDLSQRISREQMLQATKLLNIFSRSLGMVNPVNNPHMSDECCECDMCHAFAHFLQIEESKLTLQQ